MQKLDHKNLIRLHEVINDKDTDKFILVLDYAKYGELMIWDETKPLDDENAKTCIPGKDIFTELEVQRIAKDIIKGIDYMHKNHIVHRDIKPQNIMLDSFGRAKIGDFGWAEMFLDDDTLADTQGTYLFLSPECWDRKIERFAGKPWDIWSFGVTLYALVFNKLPFYSKNEMDIL